MEAWDRKPGKHHLVPAEPSERGHGAVSLAEEGRRGRTLRKRVIACGQTGTNIRLKGVEFGRRTRSGLFVAVTRRALKGKCVQGFGFPSPRLVQKTKVVLLKRKGSILMHEKKESFGISLVEDDRGTTRTCGQLLEAAKLDKYFCIHFIDWPNEA